MDVRHRIIATLKDAPSSSGFFGSPVGNDWLAMLNDVYNKILREYGKFHQGKESVRCAQGQADIALEHFINSPDEESLDFLEMCFQSWHYRSGDKGVQLVNEILIETNIGYQFTPYIKRDGIVDPSIKTLGTPIETQYPIAFKRDGEYGSQIVQEALIILSDARFKIASEEFVKALDRLKDGDLTGAMTNCGSSLESVLKAICDIKNWQYDIRDTAATLIKICKDNGLFPPEGVYSSIVENVATLRNRLSDAHGRHGQTFVVDDRHVKHLLNLTATNIIFLAGL